MQYSEGRVGRVFAIRLEHGDKMPDVLEKFAAEKKIQSGMAIMVGGADDGSKFVVGPEDGKKMPPVPMIDALKGVHEVAAVGAIFPDEKGRPQLHMHAAFGRGGKTKSGCIRAGIVTWHILEIILIEIVGLDAARLPDANTGFHLLQCGKTKTMHLKRGD